MMQEQPPIDTGKDILILLTGSWVNAETGEERCAERKAVH